MLLILYIMIVPLIFDCIRYYSTGYIMTGKKRIRYKIKKNGKIADTKYIDVKKKDSKRYNIHADSDVYLECRNNRLLIWTDEYSGSVLHSGKYSIGNNMEIIIKRRLPGLFLTVSSAAVMMLSVVLVKPYVKNVGMNAFCTSTRPVSLNHQFSDEIDKEAYKDIKNYLIVGSDARAGLSSSRPDVTLLLSYNSNTKRIKIISLLRDTYVTMKDNGATTAETLVPGSPSYEVLRDEIGTPWLKGKLNASVTLTDGDTINTDRWAAGLNSFVNTIEYNFKIPVEGIISISWDDFRNFIDTIGGVSVEITEDMLAENESEEGHFMGINPVLENQNNLYGLNDRITEAGFQHLNSNQALAYVRLRYVRGGTNSDIERSQRIRSFVTEILRQKNFSLISLASEKKISETVSGMYSSLTREQFAELTDIVFSVPTPDSAGYLPYEFHTINNSKYEFLAVDGKSEDRLDIQAMNILCDQK